MVSLNTPSWTPRLALPLLVLSVALALAVSATSGGSVQAAAGDVAFDPVVDVQLNAAGIDVTWTSADEEDGQVEWGTDGTFPNTANDVRPADFADRLNKRSHRVSISGVTGGATINYRIVSGGVTQSTQSVTIPSNPLVSAATLLLGSVTYPDGSAVRECLVDMRVSQVTFGAPLFSLYVNGLTDGGSYTLDITNIRQDPANVIPGLGPFNNNFDNALTYDVASANATIYVTAKCDNDQQGSTSITTDSADTAGGNYINVDVQVTQPPTLSIADVTVNESAGTATLTVTMSKAAAGDVDFDFATADGTASAGDDFGAQGSGAQVSGTATIPTGQTTTQLTVAIIDDSTEEADETFTVALSNPTGGAVVSSSNGTATVTIPANDIPPSTISINDVSVAEDVGTVMLTVSIDKVSAGDITVEVASADGGAKAPGDYEATSTTVTIPAGQTSSKVSVAIVDDTTEESNETFDVKL